MIGATPLTAILGSGTDPTDHEAMRAYIRALCSHGFAVLFIQPGTKAPADMRTPQKRNADDRAAREAAREAGRPDWERVRAPAGLALATTDATTALRYLDKYVEVYSTFTNDDGAGNPTEPRMVEPVAVSLALEVGRSRLVTVDCDTAEQTAEFLAMSGAPPDTPPTVRSPGKVAPDGTWLHRDGGHFHFTLPEDVNLPTEQGSMNLGETGFAVMWSSRYVLIPPSRRAEGPYELAGRDYPVPDWIATEIDSRCRARRERIDRRAAEPSELGDAIDRWAAAATWESILAPLGWVPASADSSCGCPAWTAPGDHASPKSATAHDAGCTSGLWSSDVNAPLHIWTDHPGEPFDSWIAAHDGITTLTKFQAVVASEYGGDMAAAVDDLGLAPGQVSIEGVSLRNLADQPAVANLAPDDEPVTANLGQELPAFEATSLADLADTTFPDTGGTDPATGLYLPSNDGMPRIAPLAFWADVDPPQFIIDGLFEHGGLSALIGAPGAGKALALDTPLPTPTGWTTMGEVRVGDLLIGADGQPTRVVAATEVMRGRPCYEVAFSDGSVIVADEQHQWNTVTRAERQRGDDGATRTTAEILATLRIGQDQRVNHAVALAAPITVEERTDLPLPPYTLGAWLGDGTASGNGFTSADPEIIERITAEGIVVRTLGAPFQYSLKTHAEDISRIELRSCEVCGDEFVPATTAVRTCGKSCGGKLTGPSRAEQPTCTRCGGPATSGHGPCIRCHLTQTFTGRLREAGVLNDKHIPAAYLRAGEKQRRALLAGLLDTDGTVARGSVQFSNTNRRLVEDACELIASLGYRYAVNTKPVKGRTEATSTAYTVQFSTADTVFGLARKDETHRSRRASESIARSRYRYITDIRPTVSVPVRCVQVERSMYLAGRAMIPTHNSSVALDMICHIATGRAWQGRQVLKTRVLYLPGEGLAGAVQRIMAWCEARNMPPELDLEIGQPIIQLGATREAWAELRSYVARREIGLIVFDTFARMATGIEENSATEVGLAIKRFDQVREMTNCGVMVVHHTGKANPTAARGSSALNGAVDSEVLVVADDERVPHGDDWARPIRLKVTKQKNAEYDGEWVELLMTNWQGRAPLITGPNGSIDPMQGEILMARPVAEPLIETAVRIRGFVDRFTEQGVTRADIMAGVDMDPHTRERRNAARHWRLKVAEAVDRALRYGLLETLSGTPSGARYVPGPTGVEAARAAAAAEVMEP